MSEQATMDEPTTEHRGRGRPKTVQPPQPAQVGGMSQSGPVTPPSPPPADALEARFAAQQAALREAQAKEPQPVQVGGVMPSNPVVTPATAVPQKGPVQVGGVMPRIDPNAPRVPLATAEAPKPKPAAPPPPAEPIPGARVGVWVQYCDHQEGSHCRVYPAVLHSESVTTPGTWNLGVVKSLPGQFTVRRNIACSAEVKPNTWRFVPKD